jgi:fatty acid desaturase
VTGRREARPRRWLVVTIVLFVAVPVLLYLATFDGWPSESWMVALVALAVTFLAWISGGILR